ncbi:DUF2255 family protein [Streptomyces sp. NPDC087844]|uniref:DUF2255 family protein n=1 Tax=Streptomyces sp. NPDC087844 TaxID=3365805 RepID=UPI0038228E9F
MPVDVFTLCRHGRSYVGSLFGGISETQEMPDFAAEHQVTADIELMSAQESNSVYERVSPSYVRNRFVVDGSASADLKARQAKSLLPDDSGLIPEPPQPGVQRMPALPRPWKVRTMTTWRDSDLAGIGTAEELVLQSERGDGTLRSPVTMWVVRAGDRLYVRSVKGVDGPWYRGTRSRQRGRVAAGGVRADVTFHDADPGDHADIDAAYRAKYGRYTSIVEHVLTAAARAATLRLEPR